VGRCSLDASGSGWGPVVVLVNTVMNIRVPQKAGNFLTTSMTVSFSRRSLLYGVGQ
jgi:hypothetical protein